MIVSQSVVWAPRVVASPVERESGDTVCVVPPPTNKTRACLTDLLPGPDPLSSARLGSPRGAGRGPRPRALHCIAKQSKQCAGIPLPWGGGGIHPATPKGGKRMIMHEVRCKVGLPSRTDRPTCAAPRPRGAAGSAARGRLPPPHPHPGQGLGGGGNVLRRPEAAGAGLPVAPEEAERGAVSGGGRSDYLGRGA